MSLAFFIIGFLITGIPASRASAMSDPEPLGAFASMLLFLFMALVSSLASHILVSFKTGRVPNKLVSLVSGALSAGAFCLILASVHHGFRFLPALLGALIVAAAISAALARFRPRTPSK